MRVMVQGTMSGAGKSLLAAALCRIFKQDGLKAVPFKSQNMALNSHVTLDGREMGRAQAMQAQAAGVEPDVRMNPVLLKPSSDTGSQLVVMGEARGDYSAAEYFKMKGSLAPTIREAFESLAAEADVVVIEGAGSPAEINLKEGDIVNMGLARMVDAPVMLVGDIDRGGVFAQLYGTVALLEPDERARVFGLVVNKFRGDKAILDPGLSMLEERCGVPVLGVVPYLRVDLDDEDSLSPRLQGRGGGRAGEGLLDVAIVRLPRISNFTDFAPLERCPQMSVRYVGDAAGMGEPDLVVLPGTKSTMSDLAWLRGSGLAEAVRALSLSGRSAVLGVCGGYQMLGERLSDPVGSEGGGEAAGLGLLPCETVFGPEKSLRRARGMAVAPGLSGARVEGYEIHCGRTRVDGVAPFCLLEDEGEGGGEGGPGLAPRRDGAVSADGSVMGTYLHGLFDTGELADALASWLQARREARGQAPAAGTEGARDAPDAPPAAGAGAAPSALGASRVEPRAAYQERQFDLLADAVRSSIDMGAVYCEMERKGALI